MPPAMSYSPGKQKPVAHIRGIGHRPVGDEDEEHRRPVHDHHVAGFDHADADRLGRRVDRPGRDRRAGAQPGLGRRRRRHLAGDLVRPQQLRQPLELDDRLGEARRPTRAAGDRSAGCSRTPVWRSITYSPVRRRTR